jgi:NDP-sugar pyrophosphorylase family protein
MDKEDNQVMILAAGVGSRLDPLTSHIPKPLCPILGRPVMEHIIRLCKKHGFTEFSANTHVMGEKIGSYFKGIKSDLDVTLNLVNEDELTGVAGGIRTCKQYLTDDVILVMMGDALTDVDLTRLYESHIKSDFPVTVGIKQVEDTSQYGVVLADEKRKIISFQEKPKAEDALSNWANTGIYFFDRKIIDEIPPIEERQKFDIATDLFQKLMAKGIALQAVNINAYWADIGTLKQYQQSIKDALNGKVKIDIAAEKTSFGYKGKGVIVAPSAKIEGKVYLGNNVKIGPNVKITGDVYIEDNVIIDSNSYINNSIIWGNSFIGENVKVISSIIGNNCIVSDGLEMISNSVWAPNSQIDDGTKPSVVLS